jgi:23S rRNA (guanosine2251-2'-O)-methyltransferase
VRYVTGLRSIEEHLQKKELRGTLYYAKESKRTKELLRAAGRHGGIRSVHIEEEDITRMAGFDSHKGILLAVEGGDAPGKRGRKRAETLEDLLEELRGHDSSIILVLDGITDPRNLGAILRSAEQFGVDGVVLQDKHSPKLTAAVSQSSAGAEAYISLLRTVNLSRAVEVLKEYGFWVYAADPSGAPLYDQDLTGKTALVLGAEGSGVRPNVKKHCDGSISIPMSGRLDSLNVSVAAGVLLYEVHRQRRR